MDVDVKYVGWDIPNEFVVGYGLDYDEQLPQPARHRDPRAARLLLTGSPRAVDQSGQPAPRTLAFTCTVGLSRGPTKPETSEPSPWFE